MGFHSNFNSEDVNLFKDMGNCPSHPETSCVTMKATELLFDLSNPERAELMRYYRNLKSLTIILDFLLIHENNRMFEEIYNGLQTHLPDLESITIRNRSILLRSPEFKILKMYEGSNMNLRFKYYNNFVVSANLKCRSAMLSKYIISTNYVALDALLMSGN